MGKSSNPTFAGDKEFEKIHLKEKFSYGLGDVACNVVFALTTSLLIYFYTNVVGISAAMIGTIMLISRFFDGGSDVVMGFIVDRTHSKWGQSRPWILWMSAVCAECDPAVQRTAHQRHDPVPVHLCHL